MQRITIVGHGIAAVTAADTLRAEGFDGELTVIADEPYAPYSRPALSKAALIEVGEMTAHALPEPDHGAQVVHARACDLDVQRREVVLDTGERVPYDGLVVASGSRALTLGGPDAASVELTLRGLDDALALRGRIRERPQVIVVGGGPLAMEVASGCVEAGCAVTVVARRRPMTAQLGELLARMCTDAATEAGVVIRHSPTIAVGVDSGSAVVTLADGTRISGDLVVTAIGDTANTGWLASSGLLRPDGLVVDTRGRVDERVVAAGDVAVIPTASGLRRIPLWTSAIEQARVAAAALLRGDDATPLQLQPYFWTEQFGLAIKACGELPVDGVPDVQAGDIAARSALLTWSQADGSCTAVSVNHRIPVPRLRALTRAPLVTA